VVNGKVKRQKGGRVKKGIYLKKKRKERDEGATFHGKM